MISILKSLRNNGENNGNIMIKTMDGSIICHSCRNLLRHIFMHNFDCSTCNSKKEIRPGTIYIETIIEYELSVFVIISLYDLSGQLMCDNFNPLRNH